MLKILLIVIGILILLAVLYLAAIMPHMAHRPDLKPFQGWLYAHRGLHNNKSAAPENSLAAFRKAAEAGFGIEMDIQLTKDRVPVVIHDYTLARVCKKDVRVDSLTLEELKTGYTLYKSKEHVPTLEEVLKAVDGRVPLIVEFKAEDTDIDLCPIAAPILDAYKGVWCMESFNPLCVRWYKKNRPRVMRGQLSDNFIKGKEEGNPFTFWILQNLLLNFLGKPDFIAFHHIYKEMLSFRLNKKLFRIPTFAWTIKNKEQLEAAKDMFDFMIFDSFMPHGGRGKEGAV